MTTRSFKSRLEALERLEQVAHDRPRCERRYLLPTAAYPRAIVQAFRAGDLCVVNGCIAVDPNPNRTPWHCHWIADVLNALEGWGDVFLDAAEIAAARELLDLGWLHYGQPDDIVIYPAPAPAWHTTISHAQAHELYMTDRLRYQAVYETGRHIAAAAQVAAWRLGSPIETPGALSGWLETARPFTLSPAMVDAIGPIVVSGLAASGLGYDPDALMEADYDEAL